jgi:hypothetical protein
MEPTLTTGRGEPSGSKLIVFPHIEWLVQTFLWFCQQQEKVRWIFREGNKTTAKTGCFSGYSSGR